MLSDTFLGLQVKLDHSSQSYIHYVSISIDDINAEYSITVFRKASYTPFHSSSSLTPLLSERNIYPFTFSPAGSSDAWNHKMAALVLYLNMNSYTQFSLCNQCTLANNKSDFFIPHIYKTNVLVKIFQQIKKTAKTSPMQNNMYSKLKSTTILRNLRKTRVFNWP